MRLVMPPAVSVPLAAIFLGLYVLVFGTPHAFPAFSGFIVGYLTYDYMHYHVHHHVPKTKFGKRCAPTTCATTSRTTAMASVFPRPLWDAIMGTLPRRRKDCRASDRA